VFRTAGSSVAVVRSAISSFIAMLTAYVRRLRFLQH